jgi:HlyD family secretion protein
VPGVVTQVFVKVGDTVKAQDPLFKIDDRDLQGELLVRNAAAASARAKVKVDEATLADSKNQLSLYQAVNDPRAITREEMDRRKFAVMTAEARLEQSKAEVESAMAQVQATQTNIERLTVRASVAGRVLQMKIHPGEFAPAGVLQQPLILLGDVNTLNVRVDIDENDAWRLHHEAKAVAYVRGNRDLSTSLAFVRVEPYVIPKRSLTGESTERVDTRVLQVLYSFPAGKLPVYVGQQMDVFIDAPPVSGGVDTARTSDTPAAAGGT